MCIPILSRAHSPTYPTAVERKLYTKYLARKPLGVREAARLLVTGKLQVAARRAAMGVLQPSPPPPAGKAPS